MYKFYKQISQQSFFKDKNGKVVIAQFPNTPLILWFITFLISFFPLQSRLSNFFDLISFGAIFTWSWLEIFDGVNIFRRVLGLFVVTIVILIRLG